jgi:hypothetical protein
MWRQSIRSRGRTATGRSSRRSEDVTKAVFDMVDVVRYGGDLALRAAIRTRR